MPTDKYTTRVPVIEFGPGKDGKINLYERLADRKYSTKEAIDIRKGRKLLLASIDPVPNENSEGNDLEKTLKKAVSTLLEGHPQSNEKRWENYLRRYMERDDAIVFITEGAVYAYNASQTAGETPLPEDTGFARVVLNVEIREKGRRREEKVANYYVVRMRDCKK